MSTLTTLLPASDFSRTAKDAISGKEKLTVRTSKVEQFLATGWKLRSKSKQTCVVERELSDFRKFELKVWYMCFVLGFPKLGPKLGATLTRDSGSTNQIDVIAASEDITLVFECKCSTSNNSKAFDANVDVPKLKDNTGEIRKVYRETEEGPTKVKGLVCLSGIRATAADRARCEDAGQRILDEGTVDYYIDLASRIGPAAYYQFLGEIMPGEEIPSMKDIKVPCVRTKIGPCVAYQIALTPEYLLKLAYVSHRAGSSDGYQRMVTRNRIKAMQQFIDQGGFFPTNIVINFRAERLKPRFEPFSVEHAGSGDSKFGMLILPASFGCAWVIDGQHRLISYAGHKWASVATLPVTAFEGLDPSKEAQLFEDINGKQKKVSAALLSELFATLHMSSTNAKYQARAMASSTVDQLKRQKGGSFFGRIVGADEKSSDIKCITVKQFADALSNPGFFYWKLNGDKLQSGGPFWLGDPFKSVEKGCELLEAWFGAIRSGCAEEWKLGETGIVATNRGVSACLRVLRDVFVRLRKEDPDFDSWPEEKIIDAIQHFGLIAGESFHKLRTTEFEAARTSYGSGAVPEYHYTIVRYIRSEGFHDFESEGFAKWLDEKESVSVDDAMLLVKDLEKAISLTARKLLSDKYEDPWKEVPSNIRVSAGARLQERDPNDDIWNYLELIDYRDIAKKHWDVFRDKLGMGKQGKDEGTKWLVELNDIRRDTYHASGARLKAHQVSALRELKTELSRHGIQF